MKLVSPLVGLTICFASLAATAAPRVESATVAQARELVDTYYGRRENLTRATALLAKAYEEDPADPHLYIQAARVAVMGRQLDFARLESKTIARYSALLDKAIALDPSIPKAYILKSEVFEKLGEFDAQLAALDRAKALGTDDPWLLVGYGRFYRRLGQPGSAFDMFAKIEARGPGVTASERKAYVTALSQLSTLAVTDKEIEDGLRKYAPLAVAARYPTDAWTPHHFAESFLGAGLYDEAITYARIALQTMDFGAARMTLAVALYAKAADLDLKGQPLDEFQPLIDEAQALGVDKPAALDHASTQPRMTNEFLRAMRQVIP